MSMWQSVLDGGEKTRVRGTMTDTKPEQTIEIDLDNGEGLTVEVFSDGLILWHTWDGYMCTSTGHGRAHNTELGF